MVIFIISSRHWKLCNRLLIDNYDMSLIKERTRHCFRKGTKFLHCYMEGTEFFGLVAAVCSWYVCYIFIGLVATVLEENGANTELQE